MDRVPCSCVRLSITLAGCLLFHCVPNSPTWSPPSVGSAAQKWPWLSCTFRCKSKARQPGSGAKSSSTGVYSAPLEQARGDALRTISHRVPAHRGSEDGVVQLPAGSLATVKRPCADLCRCLCRRPEAFLGSQDVMVANS